MKFSQPKCYFDVSMLDTDANLTLLPPSATLSSVRPLLERRRSSKLELLEKAGKYTSFISIAAINEEDESDCSED